MVEDGVGELGSDRWECAASVNANQASGTYGGMKARAEASVSSMALL